jgi:hypothetical protein
MAIYRAGAMWVLQVKGCEGLLYAATLAEAMDLAYRLALGG